MTKSFRKKVLFIVLLTLFILLLSGCSFSDLIRWGAGVQQDPDYQTWEKLSESGKLDAEGKYTADAVHVTFAKNGYLEMHYYSDPEKSVELPQSGCYLLPGDCIYASGISTHTTEGFYVFDHLDVIEYTKENTRRGKLNWQIAPEDGAAVMIPYDYEGTEIAIEPKGLFGARQIILKESADDGSRANGTWKLNEQEITEGSFTANPLENYTAEYLYDPDKYYLISSSPQYWKADLSDGVVVFNTSGAKTGVETYDVTLGAYSRADISVKEGEIFSVIYASNNTLAHKTDGRSWTASKIRQGSKLTVITSNRSKESFNIRSSVLPQISNPEETQENGSKRYIFTIEFGSSDHFLFIPSEYAVEHGRIRFLCNGKELTEKSLLNSGMEIICEAAETEDGYWLPQDGIHILVNGPQTEQALRKIRFYPYRTVSVLFDQPKAGGKILYRENGTELTGNSADLYCGTTITASFEPDNGWESQLGNQSTYTVTETNNQVIGFDGRFADDIFRELENHKPRFSLEVNQNIAACKISVSAGGYHPGAEQFKGGNTLFGGFKSIVSNQKIGTGQDINLVFSDLDYTDENNALKISIIKATDKGEFREVLYAARANTPINIELSKEIIYKSISVKVEAVKAKALSLYEIENADIHVKFADIKPENSSSADSILSSGTLISGERQLAVSILPHEGYFMTGPDTKNDIYSKNMSFEDYGKLNLQNLQSQVHKICTVFLNPEDAFGKVEYLVDGQPCNGEIQIRQDKEILIRYTLEDEAYEIAADRDPLTQVISLVDSSASRRIEVRKKVTPEMDGGTLSREDVIQIKKKVSP